MDRLTLVCDSLTQVLVTMAGEKSYVIGVNFGVSGSCRLFVPGAYLFRSHSLRYIYQSPCDESEERIDPTSHSAFKAI